MGVFLGIYAAVMTVIVALTSRDNIGAGIQGVVMGCIFAVVVMVVLVKLGWTMPMLRSREEIAAARAERDEARRAKRGETERVADRSRPAPTRRTSTGPTNRPRRIRETRRR
jgi:hypothetical protein